MCYTRGHNSAQSGGSLTWVRAATWGRLRVDYRPTLRVLLLGYLGLGVSLIGLVGLLFGVLG